MHCWPGHGHGNWERAEGTLRAQGAWPAKPHSAGRSDIEGHTHLPGGTTPHVAARPGPDRPLPSEQVLPGATAKGQPSWDTLADQQPHAALARPACTSQDIRSNCPKAGVWALQDDSQRTGPFSLKVRERQTESGGRHGKAADCGSCRGPTPDPGAGSSLASLGV